MPLLEIVKTRHVTASIRLEEPTAALIDQYAAFLRASADEVVDKALTYVFAKDREFQEFLRTPGAAQVPSSLRVRAVPSGESANGARKAPNAVEVGNGSRLRN
ncbi:MAG TPA: hypothetical protein VGG72_28630 [Bryobacteraceae bacterium]|jgi:hypothetical protein